MMSKEHEDERDQEIDETGEKLSEEDQELLDQALANLLGFIEKETTIGYWEVINHTDEEEDG
jgi:hypothetical protein